MVKHRKGAGEGFETCGVCTERHRRRLGHLRQTAEQAGRLSALETMLEARGESTTELRGLVISGMEVAPTPSRPPPPATLRNDTRPQSRAPRPEPAALAGAETFETFSIHGTGMATPTAPGTANIEGQFAAMEARLRAQEAEIAANKLVAAASCV